MAREQLILDRYEPLGTAGAGGFGTVRIAWDPRIQRKVAIKTIGLSEADAYRAGLPGADAVQARDPSGGRWRGVQPWDEYLEELDEGSGLNAFGEPVAAKRDGAVDEPVTALAHLPGLDEARTAAKLQDTRIVGVFDFEVRGQIAYLIMEYVEGITLTRLLADYEDYLTLDVVAAVFDAVAGALSVAHKAGVLHLDIKPDNILINVDGQAKVTDFGLATLADASGTGLAGGGTIGYMPLEQMRREALDARTDEWALASVAYEMLTGDNPFRASSLADAEAAIENAELVLPSLCWDDINEEIDDVIFYALDPDRDKRYATVRDFAEEADKFLGDAEAGKRQLAVLVGDALGVEDEDDADEPAEGNRAPARSWRPDFGEWDRERVMRWTRLGARAVVAVIAGVLAFSALSTLYPTAPLLGQDAAFAVSAAGAAVAAVLGATLPPAGIIVAGALSGLSLVVAGHAVAGAAMFATALVWCYAFFRLRGPNVRRAWIWVVAVALAAALVAVLALAHPAQEAIAPVAALGAAVLASAATAR